MMIRVGIPSYAAVLLLWGSIALASAVGPDQEHDTHPEAAAQLSRLAAWRQAWERGSVQQRWLVLASQAPDAVDARAIRALAGQPIGHATIARLARTVVDQAAELPETERAALRAALQGEIEQLDADNAVTALEALPNRDQPGANAAAAVRAGLLDLAGSPRVDTGYLALMRYFASQRPAELTAIDTVVLAATLSARITPQYRNLVNWCRDQPELRAECVQAALNLGRRSDTLLTLSIAARVLELSATADAERRQVEAWQRDYREARDRAIAHGMPDEREARAWLDDSRDPEASELGLLRRRAERARGASEG